MWEPITYLPWQQARKVGDICLEARGQAGRAVLHSTGWKCERALDVRDQAVLWGLQGSGAALCWIQLAPRQTHRWLTITGLAISPHCPALLGHEVNFSLFSPNLVCSAHGSNCWVISLSLPQLSFYILLSLPVLLRLGSERAARWASGSQPALAHCRVADCKSLPKLRKTKQYLNPCL